MPTKGPFRVRILVVLAACALLGAGSPSPRRDPPPRACSGHSCCMAGARCCSGGHCREMRGAACECRMHLKAAAEAPVTGTGGHAPLAYAAALAPAFHAEDRHECPRGRAVRAVSTSAEVPDPPPRG